MNISFQQMTTWTCCRARIAKLALTGLLLMAGCVGQESLYRDIRTSRMRAYHQWRDLRTDQRRSEPSLKGELSLRDSISISLTYNKPLQSIVQEKEIARGRVLESYSHALPKVSVKGKYTRVDEAPSFDLGGGSSA